MENILLIHGALGAVSGMQPLAERLKDDGFAPQMLNFSGHGGTPFEESFGIGQFANEVLGYMDKNGIEKADIFGYSMGGYVALHLASQHPERVGKIITLATKFDWTPEAAERETKMLDPEKIEAKVPAFAAQLHERHAPNNWKELLSRTAGMMLELGQRPLLTTDILSKIIHPCLICLGDSDQMVSFEETNQASTALPNGQLKILEKTPHPFEKVNTTVFASILASFLTAD
ncbi:MAG: alpha/beta fold hydrolase [Bacteroidetes bacterium]|nr:alpha/beta fold hydrolase [Bacteroidota bacterium]